MVLLDPVWNIQALTAHDGANAHNALLALPGRIANEEDHPLAILQESFKHSLLTVVDILAGNSISEHVSRFLVDFQALSKIPEYVEHDA